MHGPSQEAEEYKPFFKYSLNKQFLTEYMLAYAFMKVGVIGLFEQ